MLRIGERVDEPLTPESQLRKCIKEMTDIPDEDVDDMLIIIDGVPVTDYKVIRRFACDIDRVQDKWKEIIFLYDAWMKKEGKKEWNGGHQFRAQGNVPPELHHIPVAIEDRIGAMHRMARRNEARKIRSPR